MFDHLQFDQLRTDTGRIIDTITHRSTGVTDWSCSGDCVAEGRQPNFTRATYAARAHAETKHAERLTDWN